MENIGTPSIAAINGFALGEGLNWLWLRILGLRQTMQMGLPEVSLGVIPGYGGTQRLANLVGRKAMEMITTASMMSADEAKEWGLVNYVCSQEAFFCKKIAEKIKKIRLWQLQGQ